MAQSPTQPPPPDDLPDETPDAVSNEDSAQPEPLATWTPPRTRTLKIVSWIIIIGFALCMIGLGIMAIVVLTGNRVPHAVPPPPPSYPSPVGTAPSEH